MADRLGQLRSSEGSDGMKVDNNRLGQLRGLDGMKVDPPSVQSSPSLRRLCRCQG